MAAIVTLTVNPAVDRSATVDRVVAEDKLRARDERFDPGGGGVNVASAIMQLGGEAEAVFTSGGVTGKLMETLLEERGVPFRALPVKENTRENIVIVENDTSRLYRFNMPGARLSSEEQDACVEAIAANDPAPDFLVLSGSLPPGVPDDFYGRVIEAVPSSVKVILDASGAALQHGVQQSVYLVKPNQRELGQLAGKEIESDHEVVHAARKLIKRGAVQAVLVSLGRGGVMLVNEGEERRISAPTVKIQSTIGAGDSAVAGTVLALQRGQSLEEAAMFGVACGTAAVMTPGTELCRREDAEALFEHMRDTQ
jgi:6-phosphofructokinase 2